MILQANYTFYCGSTHIVSQRVAARVLAWRSAHLHKKCVPDGPVGCLMEHYFRHVTVIDSIESFFGQREFFSQSSVSTVEFENTSMKMM